MATVDPVQNSSVLSFTLWLADLVAAVEDKFQFPFYHIVFEVLLAVWIIYLLTRKSYIPKQTRLELTKEEEDRLIEEWQPEPLISSSKKIRSSILNPKLIDGKASHRINIDGKDCLNLATLNFLGFVGNPDVEAAAIKTLRKYGVGTCGPRGFYGTIDVHLELEKKLAEYLGTEEAILYSYGFSTISSAIPAYAKRTDVIFVDDGVSFPIQKGIVASRSKVQWFKHNDMKDLEKKLLEQQEKDIKNPKKAAVTRRFLLIEGIYMKHGDIAPLPKIMELTKKFKTRVFIDETISFGVLGKTGKGVTEHFGIPFSDVDMIAVSMEASLGSVGGFCAGPSFVIDHQRLSGQGYCFSASLPPLLTIAAHKGIELMEEDPDMFRALQHNCESFHEMLSNQLPGCEVLGDKLSPIKHVCLKDTAGLSEEEIQDKLESICNQCIDEGLGITVAGYLNDLEIYRPRPSIRVSVNRALTKEEINFAVDVLEKAISGTLAVAAD